MSSSPPPAPPAPAAPAAGSHLSVRVLLLILNCALCGTAAEVFMKIGAVQPEATSPASWLDYLGLTSKWLWISILFTLMGFGSWSLTMRWVPLSVAFPLVNIVHVFIPLSSWWFLGESISPRRWLGIALVVAGLVVVAKPYAAMDERL